MVARILKKLSVADGMVSLSDKPSKRDPASPEGREERRRLAQEFRPEWEAECREERRAEQARAEERARTIVTAALEALEPELVQLAMAVAERICRHELRTDPAGIRDWVREGLSVIGEGVSRLVRLHPDDLGAVLGSADVAAPDIRVQGDPTLSPGDVVVEGGNAEFNARVSVRLEEVARWLGRMAEDKG